MRKMLFASVAVLGLMAGIARAEDKEIKGVLIDQKCGAKFTGKDDPEAAAAGHKKDCTISCAGKSGYEIISGKNVYKLDDASAAKAKEYLAKDDSTTKVVVKGTEKDGTLTVSSIEQQK